VIGDSLLMAAINWHSVFFFLFAAIACFFGAAVLFSANVVRMAFYLVISLAATSGLFFLAGSEFLGAMQIMIYVGGTLVLLIFGVMLTAQEAFVNMKTRGGEWVLGLIVGASLLLLLVSTAANVRAWREPHPELVKYKQSVDKAEDDARDAISYEERQAAWDGVHQPEFKPHERTTAQMGFAFTGVRVDSEEAANATLRRGQSGYLLAFQAVGMHLLIVLVGAAYLSRTKRFGAARARAVSTYQERSRTRGKLVSAWIVIGIVLNLVLAVATIAGQASFQEDYPELLIDPPSWLFPVVSLLFLANVLLLAVVWGWQRWGIIALWIIPIAQATLLATNGLDPRVAAGLAVALLIPVAVLTALVSIGRPTAWSQMD
jgi:NADH-quinone oxidoreductase subunit J